jgi:hypothetical protein
MPQAQGLLPERVRGQEPHEWPPYCSLAPAGRTRLGDRRFTLPYCRVPDSYEVAMCRSIFTCPRWDPPDYVPAVGPTD